MSNIEQLPTLPHVRSLRNGSSLAIGLRHDSPNLRIWVWGRICDAAPFIAVTIQFYLIVLLVVQFHLESQTFSRLMHLAFAGFLIHHFLPMQARLPFFAMLSLAATVAVVDDTSALSMTGPGAMLVATGFGLIGVCHLPIPFWGRVGLLCAVGAVLTVVRANSQWFPSLEGVWAVLASMFVFRLLVYLYDLKNRNAEFGFVRAISYFFMLPNACFPLYPIIDYKTFCATHFNDHAIQIYFTGVQWMFRGVIHLLLYRIVYHYGLLNIAEVRDAGDVAQFMVATYLLYLRVSGQFHIIVGLLHMFGFNLPETHHMYYLASSFTDFWRRINIYWKDFIMKLFFYPASFALRRAGTMRSIAVATLAAFFATWLLHSWQWFWFRGDFLWSWQDCAFWAILAVLVLVNAVYEAAFGRRRTLTKSMIGTRARLVLGLKTVATFVVICALWTLWSSQSAGELQILAESAVRISWDDALLIFCGLAVIGVSGAILGVSTRNNIITSAGAARASYWRSTAEICASALCAILLLTADFPSGSAGENLLTAMRQDQMNSHDLDRQRRGYYEELDVTRANQLIWRKVESPPGWTVAKHLYRDRGGFVHHELVPSTAAMLSGAPATTNRWGMRDRDYTRKKPDNAFRIVLVGSSHEVGSGVKDAETFENILEDRLNLESSGRGPARVEILNLSVGGYSVFEKLYLLEEKGFSFDPDAVIFVICTPDRQLMVGHLANVAAHKRPIPYDYVDDVFRRAHIDSRLPPLIIEHRFEPHVPQMFDWVFARLKDQCHQLGIRPFVVYRPSTTLAERRDSARRDDMLHRAAKAGLEVLDLSPAYERLEDPKALILAEWDDHTNALGHRLLADELFRQMAWRLTHRSDIETDAAE